MSILSEADKALTTELDGLQNKLSAQQEWITKLAQRVNEQAQQIADLSARLTVLEAPPAPEPEPTPTPPSAPTHVFVDAATVKARPQTGAAWDFVWVLATREWGTPDLTQLLNPHNVYTWAGALVAVATGDIAMRQKVINALTAATKSNTSRALELARNTGYIFAADLIDYRDPAFMGWVEGLVTRPATGRMGDANLFDCARFDVSDWGNVARTMLLAIALYLKREEWAQEVALTHREYIGLAVPNPRLKHQETNWYVKPKAGVNIREATIGDVHVSGVLPKDWSRGAEFQWPPVETVYMWEGVQWLTLVAYLLDRHKLILLRSCDYSIQRVWDILYRRGEASLNTPEWSLPATGDDVGLPWLMNAMSGTSYPTTPETRPAKGIAGLQWLFGAGG